MPAYLTMWVALSSARRGEGCIHVLPASVDGGYEDDDALTAPIELVERLAASSQRRESTHGVAAEPDGAAAETERVGPVSEGVAVECACGDAVLWGGKTVHWGGPVALSAPHARKSLAFAFCTPECASEAERIAAVHAWDRHCHPSRQTPTPLGAKRKRTECSDAPLDRPALRTTMPSLGARLRLIALQLCVYDEVQPQPHGVAKLLEKAFAAGSDGESRAEQPE